jgi:beta-glucosidase
MKAIRSLIGLAAALSLTLTSVAAAQSPKASARVEALLARMTPAEKVGQLNLVPGGRQKALNSRLEGEGLNAVRRGEAGSYLHVAGAERLREVQRIAVEESRLKIPLLFAMDVVHGYRTIFPVPLGLAASWDPDVAETAARVAGREAAAAGLNWTFAPMIDVARDPRWGRIVEGAGEDPYLNSVMAVAQVRGFQGDDLSRPDVLMATAKHFAAYGAALGGRDYAGADISERTLHEVYLPPFRAAQNAGAASFMTAFNEIGGQPVTADQGLVRGVLRTDWGYQGLVVSDWNAVIELANHGVVPDQAGAAVAALGASVDVDMAGLAYAQHLEAAAARDPKVGAWLDDAVRRVLTAKEKLGLFDNPYARHDTAREKAVMLSPEHRAAAREAARKSIVLLKNEEGVLPLKAGLKRIAVVGSLAADANSQLGSWRGRGDASEVVSLLDGVKARAGAGVVVEYAPGAGPRSDSTTDIAAAVRTANAADLVILVVGEDFDLSGEARSRSSVELPGAQKALAAAVFATGKPVVTVLTNGRPLAVPEIDAGSKAVVEAWYLGNEAGTALAEVLFGDAGPGGRLPVAFPRTTGQLPIPYAEAPSGRPADPDLAKDTSRYLDLPITPLYPFGHGLSYTRFDYSNLQVSTPSIAADGRVRISATVRNAGAREGDEVVQLYVRDPVARISRPIKQLRGFERLTLKPGESRRVSFDLSASQVAFYDRDGRWIVEPGRIEVQVGASAADIRLTGGFEITGQATTTEPAASILTPVTVQ